MNKILQYPNIQCIEKYGSLIFLKNFYEKVWGSYDECVENDRKLYELFKSENDGKNFIIDARVRVLDSMYSTRVTHISKVIAKVESIFKEKQEFDVEKVSKDLKESIDQYSNTRQERSFFSKYFHWYCEVNREESSPIYDKNVRVGLLYYVNDIGECEDLKSLKTKLKIMSRKNDSKEYNPINYLGQSFFVNKMKYPDFEKNMKEFITKLNIELQGKKEFSIKDWKHKVSIYRLIDKFLWLTYKINQEDKSKINIPSNVKEAYEEFIIKFCNSHN